MPKEYARLVLSNLVQARVPLCCQSRVYRRLSRTQMQATPVAYFHVFLSGVVASRVFVLLCLVDKETGRSGRDRVETGRTAVRRTAAVRRNKGSSARHGAGATGAQIRLHARTLVEVVMPRHPCQAMTRTCDLRIPVVGWIGHQLVLLGTWYQQRASPWKSVLDVLHLAAS